MWFSALCNVQLIIPYADKQKMSWKANNSAGKSMKDIGAHLLSVVS